MYSLIHNDYGIETKEEKKKETEEEYNQPTAISNLKSSLERIRSDEYTASDFLNKYIKIDNKNKVRDIINAMFDIDKINYTNLFDKIPQTFNSEINNIYDQNTQNTFRLLFKALMHHYYGYIYKNHRDKIIENRKGPNYSKYLDDIASYFSNNSIIVLTDGKGNKLSTTSNENLISLLNDLNQYDANYEYPMENYVVSLAEKHNLTNNQSEKIAPVQTLWNFLRSLVSANSYITAYGRILKEMKNANISNMDQYNIEHMLYIPDKLMNSPILYPGGIGNKYLDLSDYGYDGPIIDEYNELVYYDQDKKRHTDFSLYYNNKIIPFMSLLNEHSSNIGLEKTNLTKNIAFFDKENFYSKTTESAEEFRTMFKNAAEATYPFLANQGNPYNKYVHPNFLINLYIEFLKKYSKNVENIQQEKEDLKASTTFSTKPQEFFKKYNRYYNESRYDKASLWDSPYRWPAIYEFSKNNDDIKNNLAYTMIKVLKNINPDLDLSTTKKADNYYSQFNDDNNALMSLSGALNEWSTKNYSNIEDFIPLKFTNKAKSSTTPYGDRTTGFIPELNTWSPSEVEDDDDMFNALFFRTFDLNNDTLKNAQTDEINDKFDNSKSGIDTLLDMAATGDNGLSVVTALITQKLIRSDYLKTPNIDNVAPTIYADLITNAVGASLLSSNPSAKFYTDLLSKIINDTNASKITSLLSSTTDSNTNDSIADAIKKVIGKEMTASASTLEGAQFVDIKNNHIFTKNDIEYLKYIRDAILASKFVGSNSENYKSKTVKELLADSEFTTNDVLDPARDLNNIINMLETDKNKNQLLTRFITNGRNSLDTVIPRYSYGELSSEKANTIRNILTDISTYFGNTEALTKLSVTENYVSKAQNDEILSSSDYSTIDKFNALNGSYETLAKWLQLQLLLNPKSVPSYKYYITEKDKDGNEIETLKTNKLDYEIDTGNPFEYIRKAFTQVGLMPAEMFSRLYLGPVYTQDPNNSEQILIEQPSDTINERFNSYFSDEFLNNSNSSVKINIGNKIAGDSPVMKFFRDKKTNNVSYSDNLLNILNELNGPHPEYIFGVDPGESGNSKNVSIKLKDFDYYAGKDSTIMKDFDKMVSFVLSKGEGFGEENVFKPIANYITKNFNGSNEALNKLLNSSNSEIINLLYRNTGGVKGGSEYIDEHGNVILASGLASIPEIAFEDLSVFSELTAREINDYLAKCYNANGSSYRPLDGMGSVFVSCAKKYKVNPRFVIAVMRQDCSLGAGSDDPNAKMGDYNHNKKFNYTSIMPAGGQGNEEMCDFSKSNYTIGSVVFQKCSTHAQMIDNIFKFFAEISFKAPRLQKTVFALNYTDGYSYSGGSPGWLSNVCTFMESFPENTIAEYITPTDAQIAFYKKIEGKAFDKESVPENKQKENTLTSALFKIAEGVWGSDLITWIRNKFSGSSDSSSSERDILYQLQGSTTRNVADTFKVALTNEKGENNAYGGISSKFGPRNFKIAPQHMGVDILPNPSGSSPRIYSPVSGTILLAKDRGKNGIEYIREYSSGNYVFNPPAGYEKSNGYGKQVLIMDENGNVHLFAHLSDYDKSLKEGESISMGQYIGHMGTTGSSTGNHLHYGIMHPDQTRYTSLDNIYYKGHVPTSGEANDGLDWKNVPSKWFSDSYGWMNPDEYLADYLGYHQDELSKEAEERAIEAAAAAAEESSETSESTTGQGSGKMSPSELLITQGLKKSSSSSSSNYGTGGSDRVIELDSRSQSILKQGIKNANAKYGRGTAIGGAGGENTAELQTLKEITGILTSINNNTAKSNMFLAAFLKAVQNGEISTDSSMFSNMIKALSANSGLQTLASVGSTGNINKDLDDSTNTLINTMNTIARQ